MPLLSALRVYRAIRSMGKSSLDVFPQNARKKWVAQKRWADDKIGKVTFLTERKSNSSMVMRKPRSRKSHMRNIAT
jgi:hypothetical protein